MKHYIFTQQTDGRRYVTVARLQLHTSVNMYGSHCFLIALFFLSEMFHKQLNLSLLVLLTKFLRKIKSVQALLQEIL